jgi:hypothetical protein
MLSRLSHGYAYGLMHPGNSPRAIGVSVERISPSSSSPLLLPSDGSASVLPAADKDPTPQGYSFLFTETCSTAIFDTSALSISNSLKVKNHLDCSRPKLIPASFYRLIQTFCSHSCEANAYALQSPFQSSYWFLSHIYSLSSP